MSSLISTVTSATATNANGASRRIARFANGVLFAVWIDASNAIKHGYSTNNGSTWTVIGTLVTGIQPVVFIDVLDNVHVAYQNASGGTTGTIYYRRGVPNAGRTSYTWTADQQVSSTATCHNPDMIAHYDGSGGSVAHVVWVDNAAAPYLWWAYVAITGAGAITLSNRTQLNVNTYDFNIYPTIDFHHNGDGKTIASALPHIYLAWYTGNINSGAGMGVHFKKAVYNAGVWTWSSDVTIDEVRNPNWLSLIFDGTRVIIGGLMNDNTGFTQNTLLFWERDEANSYTVQRTMASWAGVPSSGDPDFIQNGSLTYDPVGNIWMVGVDNLADGSKHILYKKWTRSTAATDASVSLNATGLSASYPSLARGFYTTAGLLDVIDLSGSSSPYNIYYESISAGNPTPTSVTPSNGSTLNTDVPTLGITFAAGGQQKGEWQLATDAAFTTNLRDIVESDADLAPGLSTNTEPVPTVSKLSQGTWYLRGRSISSGGLIPSPWSATNTLTVIHPPTAGSLSPTGSQYVAYNAAGITFTWAFQSTSPPSTQTAYQVVVERNSDGLLIVDTGKVLSTSLSVLLSIAATYKDTDLRWRVRLWDNDNVVGAYTANQIFRTGDPSVVTITAPVNGSFVSVNNPQVTWTFTSSGGRTQTSYRVVFKRNTDNAVLYDSGTITGSATSFQPSGVLIDNNVAHTVTVTVNDTGQLQASGSSVFTTSWILPAQAGFTVNVSSFATKGYVELKWNNSTKDVAWYSWRIYRRLTGGTWILVDEILVDQPIYTYHDYLAATNQLQDWAIVQVVSRFGTLVESTKSPTTDTPVDDHYWIINANNSDTVNLRLSRVTGDSFSESYESADVHLLGRGRHTEYGDRLGYTGSLSAKLYDELGLSARRQRLLLDSMKSSKTSGWIRTPFGDVWQVDFSDLSYERVPGVGTNEFLSVTIPYSEVSI